MTHICLICHIRLHISLIQEHRSQDPACTRDPGRAHCTLTRTGRDRVRAIGGPGSIFGFGEKFAKFWILGQMLEFGREGAGAWQTPLPRSMGGMVAGAVWAMCVPGV